MSRPVQVVDTVLTVRQDHRDTKGTPPWHAAGVRSFVDCEIDGPDLRYA